MLTALLIAHGAAAQSYAPPAGQAARFDGSQLHIMLPDGSTVNLIPDSVTGASASVGGVALGSAGTGPMAGMTLLGGDDFASGLSVSGPSTITGTYNTTRLYESTGGGLGGATTPRSSAALLGYDVDPLHTGYLDSNRGVPVPSYADMIVQSGGRLKLKTRAVASTQETASVDQGQGLLSAMVDTGRNMVLRPPFCVESRFRLAGNPANWGGWHPTFWIKTDNPAVSGAGEEYDWEFGDDVAGVGYNYIYANAYNWASNGTSTSTGDNLAGVAEQATDQTDHTYGICVGATQVQHYYDGALVRTVTRPTGKPALQDFIVYLTNHAANFANIYNAANWTAQGNAGAVMDVDWLRAWGAGQSRRPILPIPDANIPFGGSTTVTLPTPFAEFGDGTDTPIVEAYPAELNEPGGVAGTPYAGFPTGASYSNGVITITPALSRPGRLQIAYKVGGAGDVIQPAMFNVNVGPHITTPALSLTVGTTFSRDLYPDVDCGDIVGPAGKAIQVTGLPAGVTLNGTVISGTPGAAGSGSITISAQNAIGQTASATIAYTVAAAGSGHAAPITNGLIASIDPAKLASVTSSSNAVSAIAGADGTSYAAVQATGNLQPTLTTVSGNQALRITGGQYLNWNSILPAIQADSGNTLTIVAVLQEQSYGAAQMYLDMGLASAATTNSRYDLFVGTPGAENFTVRAAPDSGSNAELDSFSGTGASIPLGANQLLVGTLTGSTDSLVLNHNAAATPLGGGTYTPPSSSGFDHASIGIRSAAGTTSLPADITLLRLLVFNRVLSSAEIAQVQSWATATYNTP